MRIKMSKKGRADRNAIDSVLDDLLGSDVEEKKKPTEKSPVKKLTNKSAKVSLTSKASDAEFYKNLKILADNSTVSKQDDDEEESLSDEGVKKLADDIGDLDDLDSNLFANLKSNQKKYQDKSVKSIKVLKKEKTTATKAYDIDDPLADLLSDNDSIKVSKKSVAVKKTKKNKESTDPDASSQSLSNNGEKAKSLDSRRSQVELPADNNNYISPDKSIVEQTNEKFQQGKKSVDSAETSTLKNIDSNETDTVLSKKPATDLTKSPNKKKHSKKVIDDDIFGDSDGLPDMSDEEVSNKPFKKAKSSDDAIPPEKATTALDNLLNVGKAVSPRKNPAPMTMLEQIMSGTRKKDNPESKPEEISFGNYSPSIGNQSERPANTANLRSVRFAADLGFDDDQLLSSSPKSSSLKKKSSNLKTSPRGLNSSIDGAFNDGLSKPSRSREQNIVSRKEDVLKTSKSSDDWLELGDDLTDQFVGSNDLLSSKRGKPLHKSVNNARSPGDWLESVDDLTDQLGSNNLLPPRRAKSINKQIKNEKNREKKNDGSFLESSDQKSGLLDASDYKKSSTTNQAKENEKKETSLEEPDDFLSLLKKKKKQKENLASRHPQQVIEPQEVAEDSQVGQSKFHMKSEERENQSQLTNSLQSSHPNLLEQQLQSNQTFQQKFVVPPNQLIQQQSFDLEKQQQYLQHLSQQSSLALLHQQQLQFQQQVLNTPLTFIPNISPMIIEATKSENIKKLAGEELSTFTLQPEQTRANLKDFHERYLKLEEEKSQSNMDYTTKIYELESKIKSLELECQYLSSWQKSAKLRHQEELSALELSNKYYLVLSKISFFF